MPLPPKELGSGLIDHSQKMTAAAMAMAEKKVWCTTVVAGVDAPPVFEFSKHDLNPVTLAVEHPIVTDRDFAIDLLRDAGRDALCDQGVTKPIRVVAPVCEHRLGRRQGIEHQRCALEVAGLTMGEQHDQRPDLAVADGVQLEVQAAFRLPDTSGNCPF